MSKKLKLCVWGFSSKSLIPMIHSLKDEGICEVPVWIGGDKAHCNFSRKDFMTMELFKFPTPTLCDKATYDQVYPHLFKFVEMFSRNDKFNRYNIFDYLNLFNMQINFFYGLLKEHQIDLVLFVRIPHYGPDKLLYELARAMGIKTLMVHQSIFPERFYYIEDVEDFGYFNNLPAVSSVEPKTIEKTHEKELFYMKNIRTFRYTLSEAVRDFKKGWNFNAFTRLKQFRQYQKNLKKLTAPNVDFSKKFVYFPLHLQPELTTSSLGMEYDDQILALERLSALLPDDWWIYVKENPKQTDYMRENLFFDRLSHLRNMVMVPIETNTYQLIQHAAFVATVTGTVCWEALTGGKNALVFGRSPYLKFPGVFSYSPDLKLEDILNYRIVHEELEAALAEHYARMAMGVINDHYTGMVENFDIEDNRQKVVCFLQMMLERYAPVTPSV